MRLGASVTLAGIFTSVLIAVPVSAAAVPKGPHPVAPAVHTLALAATAGPQLMAAPAGATQVIAAAQQQSVARFSTIGATWTRGTLTSGEQLEVRVRASGRWSGWTALEAGDAGPDLGSSDDRAAAARGVEQTAEPVWVGDADGVQARVRVPAGSRQSAPSHLRIVMVDPGTSPADADPAGTVAGDSVAAAATPEPSVYTRAEWGADESLRSYNGTDCATPSYSSTIKVGFVHHTDTSNTYTSADVPRIIRGIYAYHVQSNGWCDIGYNFLIDKFGRTWEGRYGGIDKPVVGAHTGGFNADSFAASLIGTYTSTAPNSAMLTAVTRLYAWKLAANYRDPNGSETLVSAGGGTARWPAGTPHTFSVISGHRDAGYTTCPGDSAYAQLPSIRTRVATAVGAGLVRPTATVSTTAVAVKAGVLMSQQWLLTITSAASGATVRQYAGTTSSGIAVTWDRRDSAGQPLVGTYRLTLSSSAGTLTAVPWSTTVFLPGPQVLTLHPAGLGSGTIMSSPTGITCGATCTATYPFNTSVTLSETPSEGSTFAGWSGACTGTGACAVTMSAARSVTATFTTPASTEARRADHDYDGNGTSDLAVWRPTSGTWYVRDHTPVQYGLRGDIPVPGDYDGNGTTDLAVWRPSNGTWYVRGQAPVQYGLKGDIPVAGDYDGDGRTELAVWRPSNGTWYVRGLATTQYGLSGDVPVARDYNGDGTTDLAVWRPSNGTWYLGGSVSTQYGLPGDVPVARDYNGDGRTELAVWRPSNGTWYLRANGTIQYGLARDVPVPGNYDGDGDGTTDLAVWRPSNGSWYLRGAGTIQYGLNGDSPE